MATKILIADDERNLSFVSERYLTRIGGYETAVASTGREAVELAKTFRPDFVLMDIMMPDMDGIEATAIIKQECPETMVIMVTGRPTPSTAIKALKAGAVNFVPKPYEMRQILKIIESRSGTPERENNGNGADPITPEDADAKVAQIFSDCLNSMKVSDELLLTQDEINNLLDEDPSEE